jgi:predicted CopG family antitoxin
MKWKTLTLDPEAYRLIKRAKRPRESFGDVVRRVFAEPEADIEVQIAELMANPPKVDLALLRRRQANPARSPRPSRTKRRHVA